jgi:hypothetical protein
MAAGASERQVLVALAHLYPDVMLADLSCALLETLAADKPRRSSAVAGDHC